MTTNYSDDDRDWAAYGAAREVKPERELLRLARTGDELAAQELLLWPKLHRRDMIDPEVYEAIVAGALDVAVYVATECKSPKPTGEKEKHNIAKVRASMFFKADKTARSQDHGKEAAAKSARIGLAIANGPGDPECLSDIECRVALTRDFEPIMKGKTWEQYLDERGARQRPKLIRDAEARLVEFIRWKYSPHSEGRSLREVPLDLDEELCRGLIAISFPEIRWHRDADKPFPYPPAWS